MAMTPTEMITFFKQQRTLFSGGIAIALGSRNYHHAAINIGQVFEASLMQGLIGWRCGLESPVEPFHGAVHQIEDGIRLLSTFGSASCTEDLPCGRAGILGFLVGVPSPNFTTVGLTAESLLDAVLSNALRGSCNDVAWNNGLEQLRKNKLAFLAVESYSTYYQLLHANKAELAELTELATTNFENRRKNSYYGGGLQSEGGGPDNRITADYRLAAIMKKLDYVGENPHRWLWN